MILLLFYKIKKNNQLNSVFCQICCVVYFLELFQTFLILKFEVKRFNCFCQCVAARWLLHATR